MRTKSVGVWSRSSAQPGPIRAATASVFEISARMWSRKSTPRGTLSVSMKMLSAPRLGERAVQIGGELEARVRFGDTS
ncbi:MAG: hypothetical protein OEY23_25285 [Acidimicrobiia bacterium]|nr:hypothetical protein [Acidimicrobiia bacterium]